MTALLASVRTAAEALDAARAGADLIDLKEPLDGALGALPPDEIAAIVRALRAEWPLKPVSATTGDWPGDWPAAALERMSARILALERAGLDYVKVGIAPGPGAWRCLRHLATLPAPIVPVFLCDDGVDTDIVAQAATLGFAGIMFDTARKTGQTLFDCVTPASLAPLLKLIAARGALTGVAGALGMAQLPAIRLLNPDFAGFRTALCAGERTARLDPDRVRALVLVLNSPTRATSVRASAPHRAY
jgi:uncharacterized protein (UPF0264 family)